MISRYAYHGLIWVDLESPTREEILHLGEEFGLAKLTEEELFAEHAPATIDVYDGYLYATLLCPTANDAGTVVKNAKLTAIIGRKYLITARQERIEGLFSFATEFEHVEKIDQSKKSVDGNMLFTEMLRHIYAVAHNDLKNIAHRTTTLHNALFTATPERMTKAIFNANMSLLSFKEGIAAHKGLLEAYDTAVKQFFNNEATHTISITSEHAALCNAIDAQHEILCAMQKTNLATIATNTSNRIKTLTYITITLLLVTIILHFI